MSVYLTAAKHLNHVYFLYITKYVNSTEIKMNTQLWMHAVKKGLTETSGMFVKQGGAMNAKGIKIKKHLLI